MKSHKDLDVWIKSMNLVTDIYKITKGFPKEEIYGMTNQMRRSVISIPCNVAEGASRNSKKEFVKFLYVALGSASELETQILIAERLGYIDNPSDLLNKIESIKRMTNGLINHLKRKIKS